MFHADFSPLGIPGGLSFLPCAEGLIITPSPASLYIRVYCIRLGSAVPQPKHFFKQGTDLEFCTTHIDRQRYSESVNFLIKSTTLIFSPDLFLYLNLVNWAERAGDPL